MKYNKKSSTKLLGKYKKYIGQSFYDKETSHNVKILNIDINPNGNDIMFKLSNGKTCNIAYFNTHILEKPISGRSPYIRK